jgi:hypothetical protein
LITTICDEKLIIFCQKNKSKIPPGFIFLGQSKRYFFSNYVQIPANVKDVMHDSCPHVAVWGIFQWISKTVMRTLVCTWGAQAALQSGSWGKGVEVIRIVSVQSGVIYQERQLTHCMCVIKAPMDGVDMLRLHG